MFMLNIIKLSAAVHELSCLQRKITQTNTILSVATARTVNILLILVDDIHSTAGKLGN